VDNLKKGKMKTVITLPSLEPVYPVEKAYNYKYMIPLHREEIVEKDGTKVYYHTFRVTPYHPDEIFEMDVYGDQSSDFDY
jgi:hypothetical protein